MALKMLWQEEVSRRVKTELVAGVQRVTGYGDEAPTPPSIGNVRESADPINCQGCSEPTTVTIRADVSAASGLAWVRLYYTAPGSSQTHLAMSLESGVTYKAAVGSFSLAGTLQYYVRARDNAGSEAQSSTGTVTVKACGPLPPQELPPPPVPTRNSYYVAPGGDDAGPGSLQRPWRTIQHAIRQVQAGDAVYLRAGTYAEGQINIDSSCPTGTQAQPILIVGYPGDNEMPVIDGAYTAPTGTAAQTSSDGRDFVRKGLIQFSGNVSWYTFYGLEIMRSRGTAIRCEGGSNGITVTNCYIHHIRNAGIRLIGSTGGGSGNNHIVEWCRLHDCEDWLAVDIHGTHANAISLLCCNDVIVKHNKVYHSWGEGILIIARGVTIEDNEVYDVRGVAIGLNRCRDGIVQRNLVYDTGDEHVTPKVSDRRGGLTVKTDTANGTWLSGWKQKNTNIIMRNNIVIGTQFCFCAKNWQQAGYNGMKDCQIVNNTFVNAVYDPSNRGWAGNIYLNATSDGYQNVIIKNNIFLQDLSLAPISNCTNDPGITWDHNCWSSPPEAHCRGAHDVSGNPRLVGGSSELTTNADADDYRLLAGSPCIGAGETLAVVTDDYRGTARTAPYDIGAHQT